MNKKFKIILFTLLFSTNYLGYSTAEEKLSPEEQFNKNLEKRARTDDTNFHYYPKIESDSPNLFGGASTLKQNEIFARGSVYYFNNRGLINQQGLLSSGGLPSHLQGTAQIGWGILDNLLFSTSIPFKYFLSGNPALSDPWINLKYRILENPFILSVQAEGKIPLGEGINSVPPYGTVDFNAGGMLLATKSFYPFFIQAGAGYRYRFPFQSVQNNQAVTSKYSDQINYLLNFGYNFDEIGFMFDLSGFGYYSLGTSLGTGTSSMNYLTIRPNVTYKLNNLEFNISGYIPILGLNMDYPIGINAGATIKNAFEYSKIFNLMFSKKIDSFDLEKVKDFSPVVKGKDLYLNTCSKCHALIDPENKTFDEWEPVIDRYRQKKILTKNEHSALLEFLKFYKEN
jgi:hypothetical protein